MNSNTPLKPRHTPTRPGTTPFRSSTSRFRSSLVPMNRTSPSRSATTNGKLTINPSQGRDLFRTSTPQTTRTTKFAPNLPTDATRTTPSARRFVQKTTHGGMSSITSTELFKMRIPSPDPELSGEALSKEVPDDPNRTGTIYADQFLAHKCPQNFDDLQRRQFFCVLDLRRLKYAADEIFAKKDWKLNIMNFAKEYEKSRGLIMLRYGLYEFKNVKPSEEVLKRWRATHNLPDPGPEAAKTSTTSTQNRRAAVSSTPSTKRKAEDDLGPKDNTLMASNANQNKRRNIAEEPADPVLTGPAPFKKGKRKADETDEPDENQPNKVQKPTPSAAKSKFESILNKSQSGNTSPLKRPSLTPFGSQKSSDSQSTSLTSKPNPFASSTNGLKPLPGNSTKESEPAGSVLADHKIGSAPSTKASNIFGYLSESSPGSSSGNENGNAEDDDTESESEVEEVGSQEAPPSNQPSTASSTNASVAASQNGASLFSPSKPTSTSNLFSGMDKSGDLASKGGLFGRVQMGSNGQPLRATAEQNDFTSTKQPAPEKEQSKTPAKQPGDYTFNAATTPITFGQPAASAFKASATTEVAEVAKESAKPAGTSTPSLFGASAPTSSAFQPSTSLFGASSKTSDTAEAKPNVAASSILGQKSPPLSSSLFGSTPAKPAFGGNMDTIGSDSSAGKDQQKSGPATAPGSSDPTPEAETDKALSASSKPSTLSSAPQTPSLFGSSTTKVESQANGNTGGQSVSNNVEKPSSSGLFGASPASNLFGAGNAQANGTGSAKSVFDTPKQPSTGFTFGSSKPAAGGETNGAVNGSKPATSSLFGASSTPSTNLFGSKTSEMTPAAKKSAMALPPPMFSSSSATSTNLFAPKSAAQVEKKDEPATAKAPSIFSNPPSSAAAPAPIFSFGAQSAAPAANNTPSSAPPMMFGGNNAQLGGAGAKKSDFQFGGSTPSSDPNPFAFGGEGGSSSAGSSFTFTAGGGQSFNNPFASSSAAPPSAAPSTPMFGGNSAPTQSSSFTFGQQAPSTPNPAPPSQGTSIFGQGPPIFGGSSNGGNGAPSFSFTGATPPQNNSNPFGVKPAPMVFGGAGSLQLTGGDGATRASSPFPAPSSMGTTPVNGTPEPQTQNEDGEGPQEQISLTTAGPGEEDETILHEVRAKAIKYTPVGKGSDDEEENKSPWSTQGVGPLRVLKNKTTGSVRVLLRAEPRGHIAMNKALLSDMEYKAKDKTVNFVASNDSGSGLETWVLQVKKPDFAKELASVLETNKSANKK